MLEAAIGLGLAATLGVAVLIAVVWYRLRRDRAFWHSVSPFDDELLRPEVLGFGVVKGRGRNCYVKFVTMSDASDPKHDDLAIVIRLRPPNGNRYATIGKKLVHYLDMTVADLEEDYDNGRWASVLKSYKRNRYHDEIFTPLIEKAFKDE